MNAILFRFSLPLKLRWQQLFVLLVQQTDHVFDSHFPVLSSKCIIVLQFLICMLLYAEVLKISVNYQVEYYHGKLKIQLVPITRTPAHSNCFLFPFRVQVTIVPLYCYYCIIPQELGYILITSNFHRESNIFLMCKVKI